ncbi:MAG: hypothetical protein ACLR23_00055 [Clostridia bacterium]
MLLRTSTVNVAGWSESTANAVSAAGHKKKGTPAATLAPESAGGIAADTRESESGRDGWTDVI